MMPLGIGFGSSKRREQGELADKAGHRWKPGKQQRAAGEAQAEKRHRCRDGEAYFLVRIDLIVIIEVAKGFRA